MANLIVVYKCEQFRNCKFCSHMPRHAKLGHSLTTTYILLLTTGTQRTNAQLPYAEHETNFHQTFPKIISISYLANGPALFGFPLRIFSHWG
jgi:hypothetical protein